MKRANLPWASVLVCLALSASAMAQAPEEVCTPADFNRVLDLAGDVLYMADRRTSDLEACYDADGFQFANQRSLDAYRRRHASLRRTMTDEQAARMFDVLANESHIPFRFPDDGCYARAHEMARILEANGYYSRKVFIFGDLRAPTPNHPDGFVEWGYHVAPIVTVTHANGTSEDMVFDPSLADHPVTFADWSSRQSQTTCPEVSPDDAAVPAGCYHYVTERFVYSSVSNVHASSWQPDDLRDSAAIMRQYITYQHARGH